MNVVALTGATGFVGRQVLGALQSRGHEVVAFARPCRPLPPGVRRIEITDVFAQTPDWWSQHLSGVSALVHCAWVAEPGSYLTDPRNWDCLSGTLALARGAAAAGVARVVGVGTCLEYDLSHRVLDTATPLRPATPYAAAKAATWLALSQMLPQAGVSFCWARLFYLFGAGEHPRRLVPYLHAQLSAGVPAELSHGLQIRDYLDVTEAGLRLARLAEGGPAGAVNLCSGVPITVRELAIGIARSYGREDLLRFGARPTPATDPESVLGIATELP
jgi:dTDP-6-deoxy-L-talose 4-dehydrogenase (NAD+)